MQQAEVDAASGMQVEIPYVAPSQRQTKKEVKEEIDTIVVVGQARQKRKRKAGESKPLPAADEDRHSTASASANALPKQQQSASKHEEAEPFDFAAASNILDDNPDLEDRKKKRQKKQNNKGLARQHLISYDLCETNFIFLSFYNYRGRFLWRFPSSS